MTDREEKLEACCGCPIGTCSGEFGIFRCHFAQTNKLKARIAELEEALGGMVAHSCVADTPAEDKFPEDHEAERKARAALRKSET